MTGSIIEKLSDFGTDEAVVFHDRTYTYQELAELAADWRRFLDEHEVRAGEVVTLEGAYSPQLCAGLLALIERGVVVVPLTVLPAAKRAEFLDVAQVETVITADGSGGRELSRTGQRAEHELYGQLRETGHPGLVLFSSGTTGRSKASVLDFSKVLGRYAPGGKPRRILSFLSLDHIGGINTLLHTLVQGGTVITVADRTPETIFEAIARHRVEVLPTTPTFLNMVLISGVLERHDCSALQLVTYGTEPMPIRTLKRLAEALPAVRFKQTYGLSELGILPTKSRGDDTLWVKLGAAGFEHKIVDSVLWIRSEMAMLGYLNAEAPFDEDGFFNTQDVVETDGEWVKILGRRSEIINVGGEKVYPSEVESVVLEVPGIAEATVSGHPSHVTGMIVKATVLLAPDVDEDVRAVQRRVREHCRTKLEGFKVPALVVVSEAAQHSDRYKKIRSLA
ncbi:fatty acid--CoA ligase family protein [Kitasatospora sp. NBC_01287]|uniref:class I adenylate-forming enzyme family protein n=1 Tax=Kitasatospora sp. NBC_01287 TaxID=2903573 RepID=UPI00224D7CF1|nr:fatty acid--CoA ligase family protein [Kitasatospora sp. NBC_01287]MCX4746053.1 fatty acid--CoA ligase family protein [Kitasatospora sp. NBC_01287]